MLAAGAASGRGVLVTSSPSTSQPLMSALAGKGRRWHPTPAAQARSGAATAATAAGEQHHDLTSLSLSQVTPSSLWPVGHQARAGATLGGAGRRGQRAVACGTMAPDKSQQLVNNLNQLFKLTGNTNTNSSSNSVAAVRPLKSLPPAPRSTPVTPLPPPIKSSDDEDEWHPSDGWRPRPHHLQQQQLWERIREEAALDAVLEPALATHLHSVILSHRSMDSAMAFLLANKLADGMMLGAVQLMSLIREVYHADPSILAASIADMNAVLDRDPACAKYSQCMLQFKGYQAVQVYRITHFLWNQGRQSLALALQSRVCELFAVDIHPAAVLGRGVMLDHATGIVIGETAVVGDNVSMLHHVSLGGSGTGRGVRHPHIGHGVLLGAGVAVLGPVEVGAGSKVGAGSVVVNDLPPHCVAVGVPARIVKRDIRAEPVREMDQCADFILDYVI